MRALLLFALIASPVLAQTGESARDSADRFQLDLPAGEDTDDAVTTPEEPAPEAKAPPEDPVDTPEPATEEAAPAEEEPAESPRADRLTLDTPIEALIADKRSKAVLDWNMPGLSSDKNLAKFSKLSLRQLAPLSGGRVTPDLLKKVGADLDAIK